MNCQTFHKFLNECEKDAAADLPLLLQEHLHACSSCQRAWHLHRRLFAALEREPEVALPSAFTAQVMAKLPAVPLRAEPLKERRLNFDALLMLALIPAALIGLWYAMQVPGLSFVSKDTLKTLYAFVEKLGRDFVQLTFEKVPDVITHTFGQEMIGQALQVILISGVTFLVAKSAVVLEKRIRRLFNG